MNLENPYVDNEEIKVGYLVFFISLQNDIFLKMLIKLLFYIKCITI